MSCNTPAGINPFNCYAIRPAEFDKRYNGIGRPLYWHFVDAWNRGFYDAEPKLFASEESAQKHIVENAIAGEIVQGWLNGSNGFYEGGFS